MISVTYHDRVNALQGIDLASTGPFDRVEWLDLLAHEGRLKPLIVLASEGQDSLVLPLMEGKDGLEALANWYNFLWRPMASLGADRPALIEAAARSLARRCHRITLAPMPDEGLFTRMLELAFRKAGWWVDVMPCDTNHVLAPAGRSYEHYLAARPGALRTTLKRKSGKLEVTIHSRFDSHAWDAYERVYAASWKPDEGRLAMLRRFAEQEGAAGRLRLGIASHAGQPIAAQFWTVEDHCAYIHKLAHLEELRQLSAGTVLTAALMRHVIDEDRVELVDFGTGDDPYKSMWMEEQRPRYRLECLRPWHPACWPRIIRLALRKLALDRRTG